LAAAGNDGDYSIVTYGQLARAVVRQWWGSAVMFPPFRPGLAAGNNDGRVRDSQNTVICDCHGNEAQADVIAAALNLVHWEIEHGVDV